MGTRNNVREMKDTIQGLGLSSLTVVTGSTTNTNILVDPSDIAGKLPIAPPIGDEDDIVATGVRTIDELTSGVVSATAIGSGSGSVDSITSAIMTAPPISSSTTATSDYIPPPSSSSSSSSSAVDINDRLVNKNDQGNDRESDRDRATAATAIRLLQAIGNGDDVDGNGGAVLPSSSLPPSSPVVGGKVVEVENAFTAIALALRHEAIVEVEASLFLPDKLCCSYSLEELATSFPKLVKSSLSWKEDDQPSAGADFDTRSEMEKLQRQLFEAIREGKKEKIEEIKQALECYSHIEGKSVLAFEDAPMSIPIGSSKLNTRTRATVIVPPPDTGGK